MLNSISEDTPKVLFDIANKKITGTKQSQEGFAYCNRFTRAMGNLQSFDDSTDYYVNLWRCMAKPLGTGVWFEYKGYSYVVDKVESGKKYGVIFFNSSSENFSYFLYFSLFHFIDCCCYDYKKVVWV